MPKPLIKIINRIDLSNPLDEPAGYPIHDYLRQGRQYDLSPRKVAAFIMVIFKKINEIVDEVNRLKKQKEGGTSGE